MVNAHFLLILRQPDLLISRGPLQIMWRATSGPRAWSLTYMCCRAFMRLGTNYRGEGIARSLSPVYLRVAWLRWHQGSERVSQVLIQQMNFKPLHCALRQSHVWRENGLTHLTARLRNLFHPSTKYIFTAPQSSPTVTLVRWCLRGTYFVSQMFSMRYYVTRCFTQLCYYV